MQATAQAIAELINGTVEGDPQVAVSRPSKIEEGGVGTITFLANPKYEQYIYQTTASVVLVDEQFTLETPIDATLIRVENVYAAVAQLLSYFDNGKVNSTGGIDETAVVHSTANVPASATVGATSIISAGASVGEQSIIYPQVFIGKNVKIGDRVVLHPGVKIYHDCVIGNDCTLHANVVVGADGFGFAPQEDGTFKKVAQIGNVLIEDHVEIGANSTIDRATLGSTILRSGVKLDNLIMVAHNVEIGENTVIAAQTGIAGSTKIGKNNQIGGQVGFVGHIHTANGVRVQAQSGVAASIKDDGTAVYGSPAIPYSDYLRSYAIFKKLPALYRRIAELERRLKE